nr:hypothetical protein [Nocardia thailandica]
MADNGGRELRDTAAFAKRQADAGFRSWLLMQEAAMEIEFTVFDVPELSGCEYTREGLVIAEQQIMHRFDNVSPFSADNRKLGNRFVYFLGETFRRSFEGRWVAVPPIPPATNPKVMIDVEFKSGFYNPRQMVTFVWKRRTGTELTWIYDFAQENYANWISRGRPAGAAGTATSDLRGEPGSTWTTRSGPADETVEGPPHSSVPHHRPTRPDPSCAVAGVRVTWSGWQLLSGGAGTAEAGAVRSNGPEAEFTTSPVMWACRASRVAGEVGRTLSDAVLRGSRLCLRSICGSVGAAQASALRAASSSADAVACKISVGKRSLWRYAAGVSRRSRRRPAASTVAVTLPLAAVPIPVTCWRTCWTWVALTRISAMVRSNSGSVVGTGCGFDPDRPGRKGTFIVWGSARNQVNGYGNAVSPAVGEWIGRRMRRSFHQEEVAA